MKKYTMIGLMILLVIGIVAVSGCTSSEKSNTMSPSEIKTNAQEVDVETLYTDNGTLVGKPIKFRGEVLDFRTDGLIRVSGIDIQYGYNTNYDDILVFTSGNMTVYEDAEVWVYGIFNGPKSYDTAIGGQRTVPSVIEAWAEPTGNKIN